MEELTKKERRLGDIFLDLGLITDSQLKRAIDLQKKDSCFLGEALIRIGAISKDKLYWVLADQYNLPYISNLSSEFIEPEVVKSIPEEIARGYSILPVYSTDEELSVVIHNPTNTEILNTLKKVTGKRLKIAISDRESINSVLDDFYGISRVQPVPDRGLELWSDYFEHSQLKRCIEDISGKEFLNFILISAELEGTPSIHFDLEGNELLVKFRLGDKLFVKFRGSPEWHGILLNQLKLLAGISGRNGSLIVKGRFEYEVREEKITYRLIIIKGFTGEKIILHPFRGLGEFLTLDDLGMTEGQINLVRNRTQILPGMVLLVTSSQDVIPRTMSCLLTNMNLKNDNVITFEREIYFKNEHFLQIETKDFTNEKILETLYESVSLDVDVLMIDDIKSPRILEEVLSMVMRIPKIYGAMVKESMIRTIESLFKVGEDPTFSFLNTNVIIFQQPVPVLCPYCKEEAEPEGFSALPQDLTHDVTLYKPVGCKRCNQTGYQNTASFFEILPITHEVREFALMDLPVKEKTLKIYEMIHPKIRDFVIEALKKGTIFWGDVKRILDNNHAHS
jgi:type IV pilus assembly protein PilB